MGKNHLQVKSRKMTRPGFKEIIPVFLVVPLSVIFSIYSQGYSFYETWVFLYRYLFRFLRYAFFLCLPLYLLRPIYRFILEKGQGKLVQLKDPEAIVFRPVKHWFFRPFQGIGIGFLFATKLLALIQTFTGPLIGTNQPFVSGGFHLERMLLVTLVTIIISLLLSVLWTLDDMGIRYHNRRDQELKMIGKYVGTLMPLIFGLYGLFSLLIQYPRESALPHILRIILAFYPPLVFYVMVHLHFIQGKADFRFKKEVLRKGGVWQD